MRPGKRYANNAYPSRHRCHSKTPIKQANAENHDIAVILEYLPRLGNGNLRLAWIEQYTIPMMTRTETDTFNGSKFVTRFYATFDDMMADIKCPKGSYCHEVRPNTVKIVTNAWGKTVHTTYTVEVA